jgi:hypothetical protein
MKAEQRSLSDERSLSIACFLIAIEHPADLDAIEIGRGDPEADDPTSEDVHHHHDPVALEQNRLDAEPIDAPQTVRGMSDCRESGRIVAARSRSNVMTQDAADDVFVEFDAESTRDLLGDFAASKCGLRCFISITATMSALAGPWVPVDHVVLEYRAADIFASPRHLAGGAGSKSLQSRQLAQPSGRYQQRTEPENRSIPRGYIRTPTPRALHDRQLVFDRKRLGAAIARTPPG